MKVFTDGNGTQWIISLTVGSAKRAAAESGADFFNLTVLSADGTIRLPLADTLRENPAVLVKVLYSLCREQAGKNGMTEEEFANLFDGGTLEKAMNALMDEILNFSLPAKRTEYAGFCGRTKRFTSVKHKILTEIPVNTIIQESVLPIYCAESMQQPELFM